MFIFAILTRGQSPCEPTSFVLNPEPKVPSYFSPQTSLGAGFPSSAEDYMMESIDFNCDKSKNPTTRWSDIIKLK